ncbi:MAG: S41 family peptidase [Pseudomonadota bacterium]
MFIPFTRLIAAALLGLLCAAIPFAARAQISAPAAELTAEQVAADLDEWLQWTRATHPDLDYSASAQQVDAGAAAIKADLPERMSRREAWLQLARLNRLFNDAHIGLMAPDAPDTDGETTPLGITLSDKGVSVVNGAGLVPDGTTLTRLGPMTTDAVMTRLLPLIRGESDSLRLRILELRFNAYLDLLLPGEELRTLTYRDASDVETKIALTEAVRFVPARSADYALRWQGNTAILDIPSFARDREEAFARFLPSAFAEIATRNAASLVIDLRKNGGGAHDLSDRLMAYLTDKPFASTSAVTARITAANQALIPGSTIGDVVSVPFSETVTPPETLADRFTGDVSILIGPQTYSQAIVFAASAQDNAVARLVGAPTQSPANQTGQVQTHKLGHSGFTVRAPIYIIYRLSGDRSRKPLMPDRENTEIR